MYESAPILFAAAFVFVIAVVVVLVAVGHDGRRAVWPWLGSQSWSLASEGIFDHGRSI